MEARAEFAWAEGPAVARPRASEAEADHRIANSLSQIASLVRMRGAAPDLDRAAIGPAEVRSILSETAGRIQAVAAIHRMLASRDGGVIDLGAHLGELGRMLVATLSAPGLVELELDCAPGCHCRPELASPVGLIVTELLINALKYAHPTGVGGIVRLGCRREGHSLAIEVGDDGVGLPVGADPSVDGHLGFRLVRGLVRQIGGKVVYCTHPLGLTVQLRIPLN